ncbi:MAG TPA: ABC transporter ATP-binding protein [Gemmatimonadota bacterium]|jgi:lipopolysaccharide transport system ATP-binding protein
MTEPAIRIETLGKRFARHRTGRPDTLKQLLRGFRLRRRKDHFWALRDVDLEVARGEMLGVTGRNGAGKTTLLRLMGGVMQPDEGRVVVRGRIGGLLQLGVGFHPDLTGRENVFTNGIIAGLTRREVAQRFDAIVDFAEIEDFIDSPLRTYSTGMRMRLGFATAIHAEPDVLLIDEVLTVGDLAFQQKCLDRIEQYRKDGCTIVLVSHSLDDVQRHCERALWLREGRVARLGPAENVVEDFRREMMNETLRRTPAETESVAAGGVDLVPRHNRFGSLDMVIEGVRLLDGARETTEIHSGGALSIEISYLAPESIPSPIFAVSISDQQDVHACDVSTANGGLVLPALRGRGRVVLHLDRLDLSRGAYFVNVGVYEADWAYAYDFHWRAYPLRVISDLTEPAIMSPPRRWELQAELSARHLA